MIRRCKGLTLIEVLIVIMIMGAVFGFGGTYFVSYWREHTIAVQKDFLQREARYALDFMIHGTMKQVNGKYIRVAGIIGAHKVTILHDGSPASEGEEIMLYDPNDYLGKIVAHPPDAATSLLFIPDPNDAAVRGTEHTIIPLGVSEAPIQGPFGVDAWFAGNRPEDPSLIDITLTLTQDVRGRNIEVRLTSSVVLRNRGDDGIIHAPAK